MVTDTNSVGSGVTPPGATSTDALFPDGLCDVRYGEVLLVSQDGAGSYTAAIYNSLGLNDCPQDAWDALDPAAIAAEHGALVAVRNGPRRWLLDTIVSLEPPATRTVARFGTIDMALVATVDLGPTLPVGERYAQRSVARRTIFRFAAGRQVFQLHDPDGWTYVMQAYCLAVDPTQTLATLPTLGDRLALPDGWSFRTRTLDAPLDMLSTDGVATVVQDELENTYQRLDPVTLEAMGGTR